MLRERKQEEREEEEGEKRERESVCLFVSHTRVRACFGGRTGGTMRSLDCQWMRRVVCMLCVVFLCAALGGRANAQPVCLGTYDATVQDIVTQCVVITGNLFVSGPLVYRPVLLERILGSLVIEDNSALPSLVGEFERLVQVGKNLTLVNTFLGGIDDSFGSLVSVGEQMEIALNTDLLFITRSFGNLACIIGGDFILENVPALNELGGGTFNSLRDVAGSFVLSNTGLQTTEAFFSLGNIGGSLTVTNNRLFKDATHTHIFPQPSSLFGLSNIYNVGGSIALDGLVGHFGECGNITESEGVQTTCFEGIPDDFEKTFNIFPFSFCQPYDRNDNPLWGRAVEPIPPYAGPRKVRIQRSLHYQCTQSVMTQINGTVYLGTLNDSIKKLSLQSFLSSPNAELTVFAPDDQAWVEAVGSFFQVEQLANLQNVVLNNIVQGYFPYRELRSPLEPVTFNCGLDSDELLNDLILELGSVEVLLALSSDQVVQAQTRVSAANGPETDAGAAGALPASALASCVGHCGDCAEECCCDSLCASVDDCCVDHDDVCLLANDNGAANGEGSGSTQGSGGNPNPNLLDVGSDDDSRSGGGTSSGGAYLSPFTLEVDLGPSFPQRGSCSVLRNPRPLDSEPFLRCERIAVASQPFRPVFTATSQRCRAFPGFYKPCLFPNFGKTVFLLDSVGTQAKIVEPDGPTGAQLRAGNGIIHVTGTGRVELIDGTNRPVPAGVLGLDLDDLPFRPSSTARTLGNENDDDDDSADVQSDIQT